MKKTQKSYPKYIGFRWFIWTIVFVLIDLVGLSVYIYTVSHNDAVEAGGALTQHRVSSIKPADIAGTRWVSDSETNSVVSFLTTKRNDPKGVAYDYQISTDGRVQEIGYWNILNGRVFLSPTKIMATAQNVEKITTNPQTMAIYRANSVTPVILNKAAK